MGVEELRRRHMKRMSSIMSRNELVIESKEAISVCSSDLVSKRILSQTACYNPTTQKAEKAFDYQLLTQSYQFGRFLLVSSSTSNPANLQGLWADGPTSVWNGDYHMNINMQEIYWSADATGLDEVMPPLIRFIERLAVSGQAAARDMYGYEKLHDSDVGWVAHGFTDNRLLGGMLGEAQWSLCVVCGAWLALHIWEHMSFRSTEGLLSVITDQMLPVFRGIAMFFLRESRTSLAI
jgi:hypothetical protein